MVKSCIHCGRCCASGNPCSFGRILFDITENNLQSCPALEETDGLYWCGIIKNPSIYLVGMVGNVKWKLEAMAELVSIWVGIGDGCGMNPFNEKIMTKMKQLRPPKN